MKNMPSNITPPMVEGIKSFNLCVYLMGLEGWRRGLNLKFYHDMNEYTSMRTQRKSLFGRSYSLGDKEKTHYFYQSRGDKVSNTAVRIAGSKQKTKKHLKKNKVSILPGYQFNSSHSDSSIVKAVPDKIYPIIIKPTYGSLSKGVILDIRDKDELKIALKKVRKNMGYKNVIIEKYFQGDDIRLYVVKNQVVAAVRRIPAKVKGDGIKTINELINAKNKSRLSNPYLNARKIKKNKETITILLKQGYKLDDVLEKDKIILVKNKSTMSQGVDIYDITDTISNKVKKIAVKTIEAIPNMEHGSVDMLYDGKEACVLEVNASANISLHMFPTEGKPRNVMAAILDHYFPETKGKAKAHNNMYFDYLDIVNVLKKNYTNYIEVRPLPEKPIIAKQFILSGEINYKRYSNWILKHVTDNQFYGFIQQHDLNCVMIVIANEDEKKINNFKDILIKGPKKTHISKVEMNDWSKELNNGFIIK